MRRTEYRLGILLGLTFVAQIASKYMQGPEVLWEMLWTCNAAAFLVVVGVLADRSKITSVGWLMFASVGIWVYIVNLASGAHAGSPTTLPSIAMHVLTPIVGYMHIRRRLLWRRVVPASLAVQFVLTTSSRWLTPAHLNINVAHEIWPPLRPLFDDFWVVMFINMLLFVIAFQLGFVICRRFGLVEPPANTTVTDTAMGAQPTVPLGERPRRRHQSRESTATPRGPR